MVNMTSKISLRFGETQTDWKSPPWGRKDERGLLCGQDSSWSSWSRNPQSRERDLEEGLQVRRGGASSLRRPQKEPRRRYWSTWLMAPALPVHLLVDEAQILPVSPAQEWWVCDTQPLSPGLDRSAESSLRGRSQSTCFLLPFVSHVS